MKADPAISAEEATRLIPGPSDRGFRIGLYLEHLEEASFLYEQRLSLLDDPELAWTDLHDFEERFEAHVDALVLGDELALEVCVQQAEEGDFGELHTAVRVFCRHERMELLSAVVASLDEDDAERVKAVSDALCHDLPADWARHFETTITGDHPLYARLVTRALGYRRIQGAGALMAALGEASESYFADVLWSLGRVRASEAHATLFKTHLQHGGAASRSEATFALLRIGEPAAIQQVAGEVREQPWAALAVGLAGSRAHLPSLLEVAASDKVSTESILALGLLGDVAAVDPLLYHLGDEVLAGDAAAALYLITGADLWEDMFIPDVVDEEDLPDDEAETDEPETGEADAGEASETEESRGTTVTRISQQPETWREWWVRNAARFAASARYRLGQPYSPAALVTLLRSPQTPRNLRSLAADEIAIRYGFDIGVETDELVSRQLAALGRAEIWVAREGRRFDPGKYYFAGRPQPR